MMSDFVLPWLALVASVVATGLALFWAIMAKALSEAHPAEEARRLLGIAAGARWPHVVVPWKLRLPLPIVGAAVTLLYLALLWLQELPVEGAILVTTLCGALLAGLFLVIGQRPRPLMGYLALGLAVLMMASSALILR